MNHIIRLLTEAQERLGLTGAEVVYATAHSRPEHNGYLHVHLEVRDAAILTRVAELLHAEPVVKHSRYLQVRVPGLVVVTQYVREAVSA